MLNEGEIKQAKTVIDGLSQVEMAKLLRFAPLDHPYFDRRNGDLSDYFNKKFDEQGGMTPEISKNIGW